MANALLDFAVSRVFPALTAELAELQPLSRRLLVFRGRVVFVLAVGTLQSHDFAGHVELLLLIALRPGPLGLVRVQARISAGALAPAENPAKRMESPCHY
jgi:hypothetical protein